MGDVGDVEDTVESFASKRISRTWPTRRGSRGYDGNQTLVLKVEDNECETFCGGVVLSDFFHETSRGCACPNGNRFEEFTKLTLEVLSDIGRKQIDEDKIGQVTLPSLKISLCEVSRRLHRMPPNWSKPLCISIPVIQELSEFQEDPTIILRVSKEFVPSFHHDQMFLLSVSTIHDENSFPHLHQWLDFECFRMQTKLRTHSWLTFFAWVLQDCITWYPKGLIDLPIRYICIYIYTTKNLICAWNMSKSSSVNLYVPQLLNSQKNAGFNQCWPPKIFQIPTNKTHKALDLHPKSKLFNDLPPPTGTHLPSQTEWSAHKEYLSQLSQAVTLGGFFFTQRFCSKSPWRNKSQNVYT